MNSFYFGIEIVIFCWLFFVIAFIAIQLGFYLSVRSNSANLSNYVDTYVVGVELWNAIYVAHCSALNTIIWNNTHQYWGQESLITFSERLDYLENFINGRLVSTLDYDLGNYTETWHNILTKVRF